MSRSSRKSSPLPDSHQLPLPGGMQRLKTPVSVLVVILLLSVLAWAYFYLTTVPLNAGETTIVVGVVAITVICVRWLWTKLRARARGVDE